jgi:hypothetical protein
MTDVSKRTGNMMAKTLFIFVAASILIGLVVAGYWADYQYRKAIVRDAIRESQQEQKR